MMKILIRSLALIFILLLGSSVGAQIPPTQSSQGISYITGGVGEEESTAILAEAKQWPLLLEFSQLENGRGVWIFGSQIKILNTKNAVIFDAKADGPYMLINLTAGDYAIQASYQGVEQKKAISIKSGPVQKVSIFWK
jgi:hypothetical protein